MKEDDRSDSESPDASADTEYQRLGELVGLAIITLTLTMFVLDAFEIVFVRQVWIWPLLIVGGSLILGLKKPFRRA